MKLVAVVEYSENKLVPPTFLLVIYCYLSFIVFPIPYSGSAAYSALCSPKWKTLWQVACTHSNVPSCNPSL
jgi:hypothetical protein